MTAGRITIVAALTLVAAFAGWRELGQRPGPRSLVLQADSPDLKLTVAYEGLESPVYLTSIPGDDRVFIVEQAGRVLVARNGQIQRAPWLDITDRVGAGGERGLLSLAFHPRFRENGRFFVDYTNRHGDTRIAEFHADPTAAQADKTSEKQLVAIDQPYANHNGGHVLFGPDGALYVGMGDGGSAGDPHNNAQDTHSLLGKLLRLSVDSARPIVEAWARGLRNPWRFWFDAGLLYIADVGQNSWEEIDIEPAETPGLNYGWRVREGAHCFLNPVCGSSGYVDPVLEYDHQYGCSIIGGVVYRGHAIPWLDGEYLYSDYCDGFLRSLRYANGRVASRTTWRVCKAGSVTSFGVDGQGEVYVLSQQGKIYRIERQN